MSSTTTSADHLIQHPIVAISGASRGVGAATALRFARQGAKLVLGCSSSEAALDAVIEQCNELGAQGTVKVIGSVADDAVCRSYGAAAEENFGGLDYLVNNAGTTKFASHDKLEDLSGQDFQDIYAVNVVGPYQLSRACMPLLKQSRHPAIVMVASVAGIGPVGSSIAYAASKAAMISLTKTLANSHGPVRVNAVCPGFIDGEWLRGGLGANYEAVKSGLEARVPTGTVSTPETVADAIDYFCSRAHLTTGETLLLDGGMLLKQ